MKRWLLIAAAVAGACADGDGSTNDTEPGDPADGSVVTGPSAGSDASEQPAPPTDPSTSVAPSATGRPPADVDASVDASPTAPSQGSTPTDAGTTTPPLDADLLDSGTPWHPEAAADADAASTDAMACGPLRTYHLGNSLTHDSRPGTLSALAALIGESLETNWFVGCGTPLPYLIDPSYVPCVPAQPPRFETALENDWWDAVIVQVHAGASFAMDQEAINRVLESVDKGPAGGNTRLLLYSPWPNRDVDFDATWYEELPSITADTGTRHSLQYLRALADAVAAEHERVVGIIPVAEVLARLRTRITIGDAGTNWIHRDTDHASDFGRYVIVASMLTALFGEALPDTFTSEDFFVADSAIDAVEGELDQAEESLVRSTAWDVMQDPAFVRSVNDRRWWCASD